MALQQYYNTNDDNFVANYTGIVTAQTFTTTSGYTTDKAIIKIYLDPTVLGNMTLSIRATSAGKPTGGDLCAATLAVAGLSQDTGGVWTTFTWDATLALSASTVYALVFTVPGGSSSNNAVKWRTDATSPSYDGGSRVGSTDSGANWTIDTSRDMMFEVYSADVAIVDGEASVVGAGTIVGAAVVLWYIAAAATCVGAGSIVATATVFPIRLATTRQRLIAAGNNQLWYEDIT